MIALRIDGVKYMLISPASKKAEDLARHRTTHIWIRWSDGADRSPYPRKKIKRRNSGSLHRKSYEETECYKPFQPNPCGNYIGDCVVRIVSGSMDISWSDAIDLLATVQETTVNAREVYPRILEQNGFVHHKPIVRDEHRLDGMSFCNEMRKIYRKGERIFARVGRLHVAAIIPTSCDENEALYKIVDSWDSSKRTIGDYWVKPAIIADNDSIFIEHPNRVFIVGEKLRHPSFGIGTIIAMTPGVLTIDFESNGLRRLDEEWVRKNCSYKTTTFNGIDE